MFIMDNVVLVQEDMRYQDKYLGLRELVIKLNFEKAYDEQTVPLFQIHIEGPNDWKILCAHGEKSILIRAYHSINQAKSKEIMIVSINLESIFLGHVPLCACG